MLNKAGQTDKKISLWSLVMIIIATEFGFDNIMTGYNQMSYAGIIWYVLCGIIYMFPLAMIFAEYSGSIKNDHGGFYSWLINSVGEKGAFIGAFIWVSFWVINLLQLVSGFGINLSGVIYGEDKSQNWHLGMIDSNGVEALLGAALIIVATYLATKGIKKIAITATIGGIVSLSIIGFFMVASIVILITHGGHPAQPLHGLDSFIRSPNPQFQSPVAIISFIIYAMFAYGGLESSSGFIDKLKNPRKTFPKAMILVSIIVILMYVVGIFLCGFSLNWKRVMGRPGVNLYNNSFVVMNTLGVELSRSFGASVPTGVMFGRLLNRIFSIGLLIPLIGMLNVLIYSPIKGLIAGSSKDLWPKKIARFNKYDMPSCAMWIECLIIVTALLLISLTGKNGQQFYQIIVDMGNIGGVVPYFFIVIGFIAFKKNKNLDHPIVFFHTIKSTYVVVGMLLTAMVLAVIFNFINPIITHQYSTAFWTFAGPILFLILAQLMYHFGIIYRAKRIISDNMNYRKRNQISK